MAVDRQKKYKSKKQKEVDIKFCRWEGKLFNCLEIGKESGSGV